jgi:hypothetical protein
LKLYHGSNEQIPYPDVSRGRSPLDFGRGFYVTSSFEQAKNWAKRKTARTAKGIPVVSVYEFSDDILGSEQFSIKTFQKADEEWLDFVVANRNEEYCGLQYDIVIGPVADDRVIRVIRMYMNGTYDKEEAIKRFKSESLDNQIIFATEQALQLLSFKGAEII